MKTKQEQKEEAQEAYNAKCKEIDEQEEPLQVDKEL